MIAAIIRDRRRNTDSCLHFAEFFTIMLQGMIGSDFFISFS